MPATSPAAKSQELKPLPTRITKQQYAQLVKLRETTGMSIQEHVRRALDYYLFKPVVAVDPPTTPPRGFASTPPKTAPRVVRR
jgi:hypothetical protein